MEALEHARRVGFLGEEPLEHQIRHSLGFAHAAEAVGAAPPRSWIDLGSGGGLPGLVLAWRWSESRAVLLDANLRRCEALEAAVSALGWTGRVGVLRARAEEAGSESAWRQSQDLVVARAFGPPAVVAECAAPLLGEGGHLVVSEPPGPGAPGPARVGHPMRWPIEPLSELGLRPALFSRGEFGYQVLEQFRPCPRRYPRRTGMPAKRPLF